jgi:succinate dehydrogenase flavin-adding protein (antitoxin of CptAB toxin-antitoxin module)
VTFIDIIEKGQWKVFSLLEKYFQPEKWDVSHRVEQVITTAIRTKDWRFVEASLKRPFSPYAISTWSVFISEAIKQKDTTMFNKIVNYMQIEKRFPQEYIDEIIERANAQRHL